VTAPADTMMAAVTRRDPLAVALERLARGTPMDLGALLNDVERHAVIDGTSITAHCHCLTLDGNGRPRIEDLVEAVAEHVLDYAIPRSEYRTAHDEALRTGSSQKLVRLHIKARSLFTDLVQSGEDGELLLFALAEKILRLPQLICKMSLKTHTRMHIHGADGLHAGPDASRRSTTTGRRSYAAVGDTGTISSSYASSASSRRTRSAMATASADSSPSACRRPTANSPHDQRSDPPIRHPRFRRSARNSDSAQLRD
jgi:hypothetical protein